jgi:GntR family transcriptional regulator, rspAB operon transcriptional repressor
METPNPASFPVTFNIDLRQPSAPQIHAALREAILDLRLVPGTPISENMICQQTVVSRTPVREALIRLAQEDLIAVFPQRGSHVAPIRMQKVIEGTFVRESLEISVLRLASACWTKAHLAAAEVILAKQRAHAAAGDHLEFFREDEAFHAHFAVVAGVSGVTQIIGDAATHVIRVRRLAHPVPGYMGRAIAEHQAVLDSLRDGAIDAAVGAMRQHISRVVNSMLASLSERFPDYFEHVPNSAHRIPEAMRRYLAAQA